MAQTLDSLQIRREYTARPLANSLYKCTAQLLDSLQIKYEHTEWPLVNQL